MIITIDGPTASGKSTIAQRVAQKLNYLYINSGLLFRAVAHLSNELSVSTPELVQLISTLTYKYDEDQGAQIYYKNTNITQHLKTAAIDRKASEIATIPEIRDALLAYQRSLAHQHNSVAEGRDCGTVVFPQAAYKFYITAQIQIRAQRWIKDQAFKGNIYTLDEAKKFIEERDDRDAQRSVAPLSIPPEAHSIDTTFLTIEEAVNAVLSVIELPRS